jgi:hypothetical protein
MYLLASLDKGTKFSGQQLDNWKIETCPMSSAAFAEDPGSEIYAAWENDGQIYFRLIQRPKDFRELIGRRTVSPPGKGGGRKHPALAFNNKGDMLLAWTEGTGWNRGGSLVWQVYNNEGKLGESGNKKGAIPVWGLPSVIAEPDGRFVIFH